MHPKPAGGRAAVAALFICPGYKGNFSYAKIVRYDSPGL
jgi:hypothetical protein